MLALLNSPNRKYSFSNIDKECVLTVLGRQLNFIINLNAVESNRIVHSSTYNFKSHKITEHSEQSIFTVCIFLKMFKQDFINTLHLFSYSLVDVESTSSSKKNCDRKTIIAYADLD